MFCRFCGKQVPNGTKFCIYCGGNLDAVTPASGVPEVPAPPQPDKKGKKSPKALWLTIASVAAIAAVAVVLCLFLFGEKQKLTNFTADEIYLVSEQETTVLFSVRASKRVDSITLYQGDEEIGEMRDNGKKGDAQADDGIYTCRIELEESTRKLKTLEFTCDSETATSEVLNLYVFPGLDEKSAEEALEDYEDLTEEIFDSVERYTDDEGNIPQEDRDGALEKVLEVLNEAVEEKTVLHYSVTDHTVVVKMTSGLAMVWTPQDNRYDETGDDVSMTVMTLQPCYTDMGGAAFGVGYNIGYELPEDVNYVLEMLDVSGQKLRDTLPNYRFPNSQNYDDSAVTLDVIRSFGENQIILWHTHGGYNDAVKSFLVTGEDIDWNAYRYDPEYYGDCISNRILQSSAGKAMVSSKYITKYCADMDNSLVYLAACLSGTSSHLADAFTEKGATVVANTDTILRVYNVVMLYSTIDQMLKVNPENGEFYTLEEALATSKSIYGESDADSRYGQHGLGATPLIFGNKEYRLMEEVPTGTISGKVAKASDRSTPIGGATIEVYLGDTLYASTTADSNGQYALELPFGECTVHISAPGYISFLSYIVVGAGETTYMETFLMVQGEEGQNGTASGMVANSLTGDGEAGVKLTVTQNWNNTNPDAEVLKTLTTDSNGCYEVKLPYGNYTVIAEKDGYSKSSFNIVVQKGNTKNQDGTITPVISGSDYLITLTWEENPRDVDIHVQGYTEWGSNFHVYYRDMEYYGSVVTCELDYDDRYSYGPEHITLSAPDAGSYYFYLHKYTGSGTLASSGAKVTIEQGNRLIAVFHIPTDLGSSDYWNVFCIKDGEIIVSNTITSSPKTNYAD